MRYFLIFVISAIIIITAFPSIASAQEITVGPVTITGPSEVAEGSNFTYTVNVGHVFNSYKVVMIPSGYNLTGASPVSPQYINGTFAPITFTMTAPSVQTKLMLFFQVRAVLGNQIFYYNETVKVSVVKYTMLHAVINNPSGFDIKNLNVSFYVNGKYVGSSYVNISSNSTMNASYKWLSGQLPAGVYTVSIIINNSLVKLTNGSSYTIKIQSGNPNMVYIYSGIVAFLLIIFVVILIGAYYSRKRKPKWKK